MKQSSLETNCITATSQIILNNTLFRKIMKWLAIPLYIAASASCTLAAPNTSHKVKEESICPAKYSSKKDYLNKIDYLINQISDTHMESIDEDSLALHAVNGVLREMDPHSTLMSATEFDEFNENIDGEFGGIGIEIEWRKEGGLTVITPLDDLPAEKAGIKTNDIIVAIDNELVDNLGYMKAVKKMRGKPKTHVKITVVRTEDNGVRKKLTFNLTREIIKSTSVKYFIDGDCAYIRLSSFDKNTFTDLRTIVQNIHLCGVKGIILDMTYNPGGVLGPALEIVDMFIKKGTIVSVKGKNRSSQHIANPNNPTKFLDIPLVVMINEGSASAAEIVAAALQDHGRAVIIGRKSFGKGSVQTVMRILKDYGAKITTALHHRPNGKTIQGLGVRPDIVVPKSQSKQEAMEKIEKEDASCTADDDYQPSEASMRTMIKPKQEELDIEDEDTMSAQEEENHHAEKNEQANKINNGKKNSKTGTLIDAKTIDAKNSANKSGANNKNASMNIEAKKPGLKFDNKISSSLRISKPKTQCAMNAELITKQTALDKIYRFIDRAIYLKAKDVLRGLIIAKQMQVAKSVDSPNISSDNSSYQDTKLVDEGKS